MDVHTDVQIQMFDQILIVDKKFILFFIGDKFFIVIKLTGIDD
jgi:hypothetical protein